MTVPLYDPNGRHVAVAYKGTGVTFECPQGHRYTEDLSLAPPARRLGPTGVRLMFRQWTREAGGLTAPPCAVCWPEAGAQDSPTSPGPLQPLAPRPTPRLRPGRRRLPPIGPDRMGYRGPESAMPGGAEK